MNRTNILKTKLLAFLNGGFAPTIEANPGTDLDARFTEVKDILNLIETAVDNNHGQSVSMDSNLDSIKDELIALNSKIDAIDAKIDSIEAKVGQVKLNNMDLAKLEEDGSITYHAYIDADEDVYVIAKFDGASQTYYTNSDIDTNFNTDWGNREALTYVTKIIF